MILKSCHIENFGKLSDQDFDFTAGKNIIHEDNGWGKSTLAAFVRIMFFGFLGETKRSELENERKRFMPWQKGIYGGSIVFEVVGKEYRLERIFGTKKTGSDSFKLYDNRTNLESTDYSENIGEEIFEISHESFMRTVFIAQQDCGTSVTTDINAKIGNVSDETADMGSYDEVQGRLKKEMDRLNPDRATGELNKIGSSIFALKEAVRNKDSYIENLSKIDIELKGINEEISEKEKSLKKLQGRIKELSEIKDKKAKALEYKTLVTACEEAEKKNKELQSSFKGYVPELSETDKYIDIYDKLEDEQRTVSDFTLAPREEKIYADLTDMFSKGFPDDALLETIENEIDEINTLNEEKRKYSLSDKELEKLDESEAMFADYRPDQDDITRLINEWSERRTKKELLPSKRAHAELLDKPVETKKDNSLEKMMGMLFAAIGFVCVGLGIYTAFYLVIPAAVLLLFGLLMMGTGLFFIFKKQRTEVRVDEEKYVDRYNELIKEIENDESYIDRVDTEIRILFNRLGIEYYEEDVYSELNHIRQLLRDFEDLRERHSVYRENDFEERIESAVHKVSFFFAGFDIEAEEKDFSKLFGKVKQSATDYERLKRNEKSKNVAKEKVDEYLRVLNDFVARVSFEGIAGNVAGGALSDIEIKNILRSMRDKINEIARQKSALEEAKERKADYESSHDVSELVISGEDAGTNNEESMEALSTGFNSLKEEIDALNIHKDNFLRQRESVLNELDRIESDEGELESLVEQQLKLSHRYDVISKTKQFLEMAKVNFSSRYMDDIREGFQKYHDIISDSSEKYELDANLNISLKEMGALHDIELMSEGYKDLIGLCRRMAMVDSMYKKEKPFLILDDPFVNLDEDRLSGAMKFLDIISENYQVIYFVCHNSRA